MNTSFTTFQNIHVLAFRAKTYPKNGHHSLKYMMTNFKGTLANILDKRITAPGASWPGGRGIIAPQYFSNRRIFGNINAASENFRTLAIGKDNSLKFSPKIIELDPLLYS